MPLNNIEFTDRNCWVFDLDQTLYAHRSNVIKQIDERIAFYCQNFFQSDIAQSHEIRLRLLEKYGTTMSGLLEERNFDSEDFLHYVHDVDYSELTVCDRLKGAIATLPGKKYIYTNASRPHAERVLEKRGLANLFDGLFDISDSGFRAKPCPSAFQDFMSRFRIEAEQGVFFDDNIKNVMTAKTVGMLAFRVLEGEEPDPQETGCEFKTVYNLAEFLENISDHLKVRHEMTVK